MRRPSIRRDGRVLAVGTSRGVALWDLARGAELAFLPIGNAWHVMFEASGDLLTSGSIGVRRWPIQLDLDRGEFRIGPPRQLPLPAGDCGIAEDRSGRIVALADHDFAFVATPERTIRRGAAGRLPLRRRQPGRGMVGDRQSCGRRCPGLAHRAMRRKVAELPIDGRTGVVLQPRWEMADDGHSAVPALGGRHLARGAADRRRGVAASPPTAAWWSSSDASRVLRLVETETGRTLARLESPDLCGVQDVRPSAPTGRAWW